MGARAFPLWETPEDTSPIIANSFLGVRLVRVLVAESAKQHADAA